MVDNDIAEVSEFKEKYGSYVLYRFDKEKDFAYQFEQASNWQNAVLTTIDHDDAVEAMKMLDDKVFSCYTDSYKKQYLPRKVLLVGDIVSSAELGLSVPKSGHHVAVANINSITFAKMAKGDVDEALRDDAVMSERCADMHRAILADYLVKARGVYPVDDTYLAYSQSNYSSLMNSSRKTAAQLVKEDPNFFYSRGFFFPEEEESTYFPGAEEDIIAYLRNMLTMDCETANEFLDMPVMADKMHLLVVGLQQMGVDVMALNPNMEQFLKMEYVQPSVMYMKDVVTDCSQATLEVTILKGSHSLKRLEVNVNGVDAKSVDLSSYDKMRVVLSVPVEGLVKGANAITLKLYEEGRDKVACTVNGGVSYATMDEVIGISILRSGDHEDVYRSMKVWKGHSGVLGDEESPDLTTVAFEKHGWLDRYFMETDGEYRYWKIYKSGNTVTKIVEYLLDGYNEDFTAPLYKVVKDYAFAYSDGELTSVTLTEAGKSSRTLVSDVTYVSGRIVRYTYDGTVYEPVYATANGVTTRVDCLDSSMSGKTFGFDGTEDLNPYYMPELPAVIPGDRSEVPLQLLYSQYLFKSYDNIWKGGWTHSLEDKTNHAEVNNNGVTWTYRFKLK